MLTNEENALVSSKKEQDYLQQSRKVYRSDVLPSRTAENFFWVGRYAERVLSNARFQRTVMQFVDEANRAFIDNDQQLKKCLLSSLIAYTHTFGSLSVAVMEKKMTDPWATLADILLDNTKLGSLSSNIANFSRAVHAVRDHWSIDTWRVLREMEDAWQDAADVQHSSHYKLLGKVDKLITSMMAFISLNRESISREQGWILLDAGRKTEQSLLLISLLNETLVQRHDQAIENIMMEAVLKSNESLVNYRYKYRAHLQLNLVLDLMLLDPFNPRSLVYLLERLKAYVEVLPRIIPGHVLSEQERMALEAFTLLKLADSNHLSQAHPVSSSYQNLEIFLNRMNQLLLGISDAVSKNYFKHAQKQQQLFTTDSH